MATLTVGPTSTYPTIAAAMLAAAANDTILLEAGYGGELATVTHPGMTISGDSSSTGIVLTLGTGIATFTLAGTAPINVVDAPDGNGIVGNAGDNVITVTDGADAVSGGLGIDRLVVDYRLATGAITGNSTSNVAEAGGSRLVTMSDASIENFTILTGSGADTITTGAGDDIINTGEGASTVVAGQGANSITGGSGADTVTALDGGNFIDGGDGVNTLTSGSGDDVITGGIGADTVAAGGGNDLITTRGGADIVHAGTGTDRLVVNYSNSVTAVTMNAPAGTLAAGYAAIIADGSGNSTDFDGVEHFTITGGAANDHLTTGDGDDLIEGGAGNDTIVGGLGADTLSGGVGDDIIDYDGSDVSIAGGADTDTLLVNGAASINLSLIDQSAGDGANVSGFENVNASGSGAGVNLTGNSGANVLTGGSGNDTFSGGGGNDTVDGGGGTETIVFEGARADYTVSLSAGTYTLLDNRNGSPDGADSITNVESFQFSDGTYTAAELLNPVLDLDADNSTATGANYSVNFTENDPPVAITDSDVTINDDDNTTVQSATITLTNAQEGDLLTAGTLPSGITIGSASATQIILTGTASLADYQTALHTITFSNDGTIIDPTPRDITLVVNDGAGDSNTAHATINVALSDNGDATVTVTGLAQEDSVLTANFGDNDPDGAATAGPTYQWLRDGAAITGATGLTFTPGDEDVGHAIGVQASYTDGQGYVETIVSTPTGAVTGINDPPVLTGDLAATVAEGGSYTLTTADLNFADVDDIAAGVTFTVSALTNGQLLVGGVAAASFTGTQLQTGLVTFTHDGGETTSASFSVSVEDGNEDNSAPSQSTFNFTVTPVNDPPVLTGDLAATVAEGGSYTLTTADLNFTDVDDIAAGVTFTVSALTNGQLLVGGVAAASFTGTQLQTGLVTFTHDGGETTSASFSISVEDGNEDNSTPSQSTFNLTVTPVNGNQAPVMTSADSFTVEENATAIGTVGATDADNDTLTYSILGGADAAHFTLDQTTHALVFNTAPNFEAPQDADHDNKYQVMVEVSDGTVATAQSVTVEVSNEVGISIKGNANANRIDASHTLAGQAYPTGEEDVISGGRGNDKIDALDGNDMISGGSGNDRLVGGSGNDTVRGGVGNDKLIGSLGIDTLVGNTGVDSFIFRSLAESTSAAPDTIGDFRHVQDDNINLRGIDAKSLTPTNDAFHFIGNQAAFTHHAGELRFDKDHHLLQGDVDGDGQADFAIHLNVDHLVKGDFVL